MQTDKKTPALQKMQMLLTRLSAGPSLRWTIVLGVALGLLLPSIASSWIMLQARSDALEQKLVQDHNRLIETLEIGARAPLWEYNRRILQPLLASVFSDSRVVSGSILGMADATNKTEVFAAIEHPQRRLGRQFKLTRAIVFDGRNIGTINLEMDSGEMDAGIALERRVLVLTVLGQLLLSLLLILVLLHGRLLVPIRRLIRESDHLASGDLNSPIVWRRKDELGKLGDSLENTRHALQTLFHELQTSYNMMAKVQQEAGMGQWRWNLGTDEVLWSQTIRDIFQISLQPGARLPPGFVGVSTSLAMLAFVHPDEQQDFIEAIQAIIRREHARTLLYRIVRGDGAVRSLSTEFLLESDANGRVVFAYGFVQDITERLAAENALRTSQEQITAIYNAIPDMIAVTRFHDGVIVEINDAAVRIYGQTREEILGRTFENIQFLDDPADYRRFVGIFLTQGRVDSFECTTLTHSGKRSYSSLSARPFEIGGASHVLLITRDITELVAAESALRASQEQIMAIYNAIPDMIAVTHHGTIIDVNDAAVRIHRQRREEILGKSFDDAEFWDDPADYQRLVDILRAQGKVDAFECTMCTPSGERYRTSISARPFEIGHKTCLLSISRDITELSRKQNELLRSYAMMAKIQHNAGMGILRWDIANDEILLSQTYLDLLQRPPDPANTDALPPGFAARMRGTAGMDFIHPDDWQHYLDTVSRIMQNQQPCYAHHRIIRGDGAVRLLHSEVDTELDAQGELRSVYGFSKDITEEQRVQDELEQHRNHLEALVGQRTEELRAAIAVAESAQHAAEAANRMKSEFLAMISHEIRTPLGGVIGMLTLGLKDTRLVAATRDKFNLGLSNAQSLLQIINDILDYSKLEAGKMALEHIDFDLPAVLQDSHSILEERADAKGLSLTMELPADLPRWWQGDPVRLRQVLINLMGNAIKFTEHGSVRLRLQCSEDGWLEFAVADTGVGIPAKALPRLFQKFEQADVSTTRKFGGTGLGLAICKHIVEAMGGTISVTSTLGVGTTFRFSLPLREGKKTEIVAAIASSRHTHRLSILCAEDGKTNQLIVRELVEGMGHRIALVENGLEALRALSMRHYDMVLMDMRMPEMDGMEATQLIRAGGNERYIVLDPSLPIVALTANVMEEDRKRYLQAGMDGFLGKPIDEAALFGEIAQVIARRVAQGVELPPLAASEDPPADPPAQTADVAALDALFGVDGAALPPRDPVTAVQAVLSPRQSVSRRTWNAMIEVFRSEAPQRMARLKTALDAGDAASATLELHTLKGSAGYLQGLDVRALCATLETLANQNDLEAVSRRYAELEQTLHALLAALQPH